MSQSCSYLDAPIVVCSNKELGHEQRHDKLLELLCALERPIVQMGGQLDKIEDHLDSVSS